MKTRTLAIVMAVCLVVATEAPIAVAASPVAVTQFAPTAGNAPVVHFIVWSLEQAQKNHGYGVYGEVTYGNIFMSGARGAHCVSAYGMHGASLNSLLVTITYRHGKKPYPATTEQLMPAYASLRMSKWCIPDKLGKYSYTDWDINEVDIKTISPPVLIA